MSGAILTLGPMILNTTFYFADSEDYIRSMYKVEIIIETKNRRICTANTPSRTDIQRQLFEPNSGGFSFSLGQ